MNIKKFNLNDLDEMTGAMYFVIRKTEGSNIPYQLSIAGITLNNGRYTTWEDASQIKAASGYSMGAIQVDLGQRGDWALGATTGRPLQEGEKTYIQAIVDQSQRYAERNHLRFNHNDGTTESYDELCHQLSTHNHHGAGFTFIDTDTRNAINVWANSEEGKQWIHKNMDLPQIKNITQKAMAVVNLPIVAKNLSEEERFQAMAMLAKAANQLPSAFAPLANVLTHGGNYADLIAEVKQNTHLSAQLAIDAAKAYQTNFTRNDDVAKTLRAAQVKVLDPHYNPTSEHVNPVKEAIQLTHKQYHREIYNDPLQNKNIPTQVLSFEAYEHVMKHEPSNFPENIVDKNSPSYLSDSQQAFIASPSFSAYHETHLQTTQADWIRPITILSDAAEEYPPTEKQKEIVKEIQTICYTAHLHHQLDNKLANDANKTGLKEADDKATEALVTLQKIDPTHSISEMTQQQLATMPVARHNHTLAHQEESRAILTQTLTVIDEAAKTYKDKGGIDWSSIQAQGTKQLNAQVTWSRASNAVELAMAHNTDQHHHVTLKGPHQEKVLTDLMIVSHAADVHQQLDHNKEAHQKGTTEYNQLALADKKATQALSALHKLGENTVTQAVSTITHLPDYDKTLIANSAQAINQLATDYHAQTQAHDTAISKSSHDEKHHHHEKSPENKIDWASFQQQSLKTLNSNLAIETGVKKEAHTHVQVENTSIKQQTQEPPSVAINNKVQFNPADLNITKMDLTQAGKTLVALVPEQRQAVFDHLYECYKSSDNQLEKNQYARLLSVTQDVIEQGANYKVPEPAPDRQPQRQESLART